MSKKNHKQEAEIPAINAVEALVPNYESLMVVDEAHERALAAITSALDAVGELARIRNACKLSSSRVIAVAKELKELRKVLRLYVVNN